MKNSTVLACAIACGLGFVGAKVLDQQVYAQANGAAQGRYVFKQLGNSRVDQFMVDTETGRLWQIKTTEFDELGMRKTTVLSPTYYLLLDGSKSVNPD